MHLDDIAYLIANDGITAHEFAVDETVARFARAGLRPTLIALLADKNAAPVARERAFGTLAVDYARSPSTARARAA